MLLTRSASLFVVFIALAYPTFCYSFDESRLWLPTKYQKNYVGLLKAATTAESVERCVSVLEATIDLEQSRPDHPIFRVLCRQDNGRSYNEVVDGLSYLSLTAPPSEDLNDEAVIEKRLAALKTTYWQACQQEVESATRLMVGLTVLTVEEPEPLIFDAVAETVYAIDFDAMSPSGAKLEYQAMCSLKSDLKPVVTLQKR